MEQLGVMFVLVGMILCIIGGWKVLLEIFDDNALLRIVCLLIPVLGVAAAILNWDKLGNLKTSRWILLIGSGILLLGILLAWLGGRTG